MKIKNSFLQKSLVFLFFAFLILPYPIYFLCVNSLDTQNFENRQLADMPKLSTENIEAFSTQFEDFLNDHAAFRNQFMKLNSSIDYFVFNMTQVPEVIIGTDNWLFYNDSEVNAIRDYQGLTKFTDNELKSLSTNIQNLSDTLKSQGKELVLFIAPNKESIYSEYVPSSYPKIADTTLVDQVLPVIENNTDIKIIYPKEELIKSKDLPLYYKYDTHWNEIGGFVGTSSLLDILGLKPLKLDDITINTTQSETVSDLADISALYHIFINDCNGEIEYDSQVTTTEIIPNNHIIYENPSINNIDMLIIRDSFGEGMKKALSWQVSKVESVHENNITSDILKNTSAEYVVIEVVERHICNLNYMMEKYNTWLSE